MVEPPPERRNPEHMPAALFISIIIATAIGTALHPLMPSLEAKPQSDTLLGSAAGTLMFCCVVPIYWIVPLLTAALWAGELMQRRWHDWGADTLQSGAAQHSHWPLKRQLKVLAVALLALYPVQYGLFFVISVTMIVGIPFVIVPYLTQLILGALGLVMANDLADGLSRFLQRRNNSASWGRRLFHAAACCTVYLLVLFVVMMVFPVALAVFAMNDSDARAVGAVALAAIMLALFLFRWGARAMSGSRR